MKRLTLLIIFVFPFVIKAQNLESQKFSIEAGPEYRNTDFRWSIDGTFNGNYINYLSELIFKPVKSAGAYVKGTYRFANKFSVQASYSKLFTFRGKVTDTDYDSSNRTKPFSLTLNSSEGYMQHIQLHILYQFVNAEKLYAAVGAGYSFNKELFYLLDDNNTALRSTYQADWNGPHVALNGQYYITNNLYADADITARYLRYAAKANWNQISDWQHPVSFTHTATGFGVDATAGIGYKFTQHIKAGVYGLLSNWQTGEGVDKLFLAEGDVLTTNLNGAFKKSKGIRVSATYSF